MTDSPAFPPMSVAAVRAALAATDKYNGRYILNAVRASAGRLVSTDGRRMHIVERNDAPAPSHDEPAILVPRDVLKDACPKAHAVAINGSVESFRCLPGGSIPSPVPVRSARYTPDEGSFPEWQAVLPKDRDDDIVVCLAADFLEAAAKAAGGIHLRVTLRIAKAESSHKPIVLIAENEHERFRAVIMPITPPGSAQREGRP